MKKIQKEIITRKSTKAKVRSVLNDHVGRDMFMTINPVKLNLWNVLFRKKKLLSAIETNYVILSNEKYMLVQELGEIVKK